MVKAERLERPLRAMDAGRLEAGEIIDGPWKLEL